MLRQWIAEIGLMLKLRTECDVIDSDSNKDVDVHTDVNIVIVSIEYIQMYR